MTLTQLQGPKSKHGVVTRRCQSASVGQEGKRLHIVSVAGNTKDQPHDVSSG